jgi:hypothetical protein
MVSSYSPTSVRCISYSEQSETEMLYHLFSLKYAIKIVQEDTSASGLAADLNFMYENINNII